MGDKVLKSCGCVTLKVKRVRTHPGCSYKCNLCCAQAMADGCTVQGCRHQSQRKCCSGRAGAPPGRRAQPRASCYYQLCKLLRGVHMRVDHTQMRLSHVSERGKVNPPSGATRRRRAYLYAQAWLPVPVYLDRYIQIRTYTIYNYR